MNVVRWNGMDVLVLELGFGRVVMFKFFMLLPSAMTAFPSVCGKLFHLSPHSFGLH